MQIGKHVYRLTTSARARFAWDYFRHLLQLFTFSDCHGFICCHHQHINHIIVHVVQHSLIIMISLPSFFVIALTFFPFFWCCPIFPNCRVLHWTVMFSDVSSIPPSFFAVFSSLSCLSFLLLLHFFYSLIMYFFYLLSCFFSYLVLPSLLISLIFRLQFSFLL